MEPRKHYFAKIPTIAIFIVMAMSGPLGVLLFILKGIDQKVQKEEQEAARARGDYRARGMLIPHQSLPPPGRRSQSTVRICPPRSRKAPSNGTRTLPPSAPSWALSFCLAG